MSEVESPCTRVCVVDPDTGYCRGCYRTLKEISYWTRYAPDERQRVLDRIAERRAHRAADRTRPDSR
jgi:uncharacterized protein